MPRCQPLEKQAGVIALWNSRLCLITSRGGRRWTIPKGCMEKGMRPKDVAGMEAWEEAGLEGRIHSEPLGKYRYRKTGRVWEVDLYLMEVTRIRSNWPEEHYRKRRWIDPRMIDQWATHPGVRKALFSVFGWSKAHEAG